MEKLEKKKFIIPNEDKEDFVYEEYTTEDIVNKINEIIEFLNSLKNE